MITDLETNGSKITTDKGKAETLNRSFSSVFATEDKSSIPFLYNIGGQEQEPLEIIENMVMKVITKLKIDKSPGLNKIHNRVLYELLNEVVPPLTIFLNI